MIFNRHKFVEQTVRLGFKMIFNRHKFVEQTVRLGFKNSIKTIGYKSVEQFNNL